MNIRMRLIVAVCPTLSLLAASTHAAPRPQTTGGKFEVSFPASAHAGAIT
jgi:hypothetical protein